MKILAISPRQSATRVALYENYDCLWDELQGYAPEFLAAFPTAASQENLRLAAIKSLLADRAQPINGVNAFVSTGGLLHPIEGGTYQIGAKMLQDLAEAKYGEYPANVGAALAARLANAAGTRYAYVVNPPVVDEMNEAAHATGFPGIRRRSFFHALNQKAVAHREAANIGKPLTECNFVVCHIGYTVSIGAHECGRVVEVNDLHCGSGPMSMSSAGDLPPIPLIDACYGGQYSADEIKHRFFSESGVKGFLEVDDFSEFMRRASSGDRKANVLLDVFLLQIVKQVGACAAVLRGKVDAVILTGDFIADQYFTNQLIDRIGWVAPLVAYPGEDEMLALVEGVLRVLFAKEEARTYA